MNSKEEKEQKSVLLLVAEDFDKIDDFDPKNYQNRKYNSSNFDQGKKFFKLRYVKNKLNSTLNKKENIININEKIIPQLDPKEKEKLEQYENITLNHKKTRENIIKKYCGIFVIFLEKSIFYFNKEKLKESYDILYNFDIIQNEAEFGEVLLIISGYDKNLIHENVFKKKGKDEIIKGFLSSIEMTLFGDLFECYKFINSRVSIPFEDTNKHLIINTITDCYYEENKNNEKIINKYQTKENIFIFLSTLISRYILKSQHIKMGLDDFSSCIPFLDEKEIKILYDKINIDFTLDTDYLSEVYEKFTILLEEKEYKLNSVSIKDINNQKKIEYIYNLEKNEIIDSEIKDKNLDEKISSLIKKDFIIMSDLSFGKKEQEILSTPIQFHRISGSSTTLRDYLLCENFSVIVFEKDVFNPNTKIKVRPGNSIKIDDIIDIKLGSHGENFKKYFKSYPNEEKNQNNFITIISQKEQFDLKSTDEEKCLKWFKALMALFVDKWKNKENKNTDEKKISDDINLIWNNYIINKWNIYGNYFLFKTLDRGSYLKDANFNPEGKKQNPTIKYDIFEDRKTPFAKSINYFLKDVKDKLGKKDDKFLEYNEFMVLCELGIADSARKKIWPLLIGNKCAIMNMKENIDKIDIFEVLEEKYLNNANINFIENKTINTMIKDIIKIKYIFLPEITSKKLSQNNIMSKVFTICRAFFLYRFDIPYNKNLIYLIYAFLLKQIPEEETYKCICNLICSNNTLANIYIWKKKYIKIHEIFNEKFWNYLPKLYNHMHDLGISCQFYLFDWIESLFTNILDIKIASIIIDLYLIFGEYVLIQASITILKIMEESLINMNIEEIMKKLKCNFLDKITVYQFFECYRNFVGIKNDYINHKIKNEFGFQKTELLEILMC